MKTFIAIGAKNGQRVELSVIKDTIEQAREELHNQGYSIIEIKESDSSQSAQAQTGSMFYFDIFVDGRKKSGQIRSANILKAYQKLVDDLHYQVDFIYDDPSASEEEKRFKTNQTVQTYRVYSSQNRKHAEEPAPEAKKIDGNEIDSGSVLAKQVQKYHQLIEKIIEKITFVLSSYSEHLDEDRKFRLQEAVLALKQLKNITNPDKLRIVSELALEKVGMIELDLIRKGFIQEKKETLSETNKLLSGIGSKKKVSLPEDDFVIQAKNLWKKVAEDYFSKPEASSVVSSDSDATGTMSEFQYYKNVRELKLYEEKGSEISKELLRGFFKLRGEKRERLLLKKKLISQNVELLRNRIKNRSSSYVKIKRGISAYSESLFYLVRSLGDLLTYSVFAYVLVFSIFKAVVPFLSLEAFPHRYAFALTLFSFSGFLFKQARSWISLSISAIFAFMFFIVISINF